MGSGCILRGRHIIGGSLSTMTRAAGQSPMNNTER